MSQLKRGQIAKHFVSDKQLCIVKWEEELYIFEDHCPHQGLSFIGGKCENGWVECPIHKYKFALKQHGERSALQTFPIKADDKGVYVGIQNSFWS